MSDEKFVDPRLQAKETMFQQLHLSTFDTMSYLQTVMQSVSTTGTDISPEHEDYQQLRRDYDVTKRLAPIADSELAGLCERTDEALALNNSANATYAQLCAAATNSLNHWRIWMEVPEDLRDKQEVTEQLSMNMQQHISAWKRMLSEG